MTKIIKYIFFTFFLPVWWLQLLLPRNKNIWIFGAWMGYKYSDNAKVVFEFINNNHPEITGIWLTKDKDVYKKLIKENKKVALCNSLKGFYYSLRASKVVISSGGYDVNRFFINGAKIILTWHGAPMKKIGLDRKFVNNSRIKDIIKSIYPFIHGYNLNAVVSTATIFNDKLCSAFNIKPNQILLTGYPRNDVFFNNQFHSLIKEWNCKFENPRKIIYLPTFRDNGNFNPFDNYNFIENDWINFLERTNTILISKGHFVDNVLQTKSAFERIIHLSDKLVDDINLLLKDMDVLITDYSGAYFDFLLTKKPIILAPFDYDVYISESRELYFDYFKDISGVKCNNWSEILSILSLKDISNLVPEKVHRYNHFVDGSSCKRLTNEIKKL